MYNSGNEYLPSRLGKLEPRHIHLNPNEMYANWAWTSASDPEHVQVIGLIAAGELSGDNASYLRETDVRSSLSTPWLVIDERWSSYHSITHSHSPLLLSVFKWPVNPGSFLPRPRSCPSSGGACEQTRTGAWAWMLHHIHDFYMDCTSVRGQRG